MGSTETNPVASNHVSKKTKKLTPLMKQFWEIKNQHQDQILLFRMGDFYEMFHEDAVIAAPILNIALTSRNKKSADDTPMCGMPHHSVAGPIAKLLAAGHKVAICDQLEDPAEAKGIVKRGVTRILSPGMVYDPDTLNELKANYICSFDTHFISFIDASTGEAFYYEVHDAVDLAGLMELLQPIEVLLTGEQRTEESIAVPPKSHLTVFDQLETQWPDRFNNIPESAKRLLTYASHMQGPNLVSTLQSFEKRERSERMELSSTVVTHLELLENYRGQPNGSLFHAINRTKTWAGARLLKKWIQFPLKDLQRIQARHDRVQTWVDKPQDLKQVRERLGALGDIERRLSKMAYSSCHPRDLIALAKSLEVGCQYLSRFCFDLTPEDLQTGKLSMDLIYRSMEEEPPAQLKAGGFVRRGYNKELDELIDLAENSQAKLVQMETAEKQKTGIPSLKVRYNNVFGYYIEVTKTHTSKVPDNYKRKQTLTNAERYVTYELEELESKVLSARAKRVELEEALYKSVREQVLQNSRSLLRLAQAWSELDVVSSLAWLASEMNYCRPKMKLEGNIHIQSSRHPVIEQEVRKSFVPNDISVQRGESLLLTGPNMAGKSTLMRQVAISILMAQMGSFIPATSAELPIFHRIFTRIGASDFLSEGLSTFMVEMTETAELLRASDEKSLIVLDEIGRGTSTYDGMSLAQSILEFIVTHKKATTFFATHYHELTSLDRKYENIRNIHMAIEEEGSELHFSYVLAEGPANRSYGIHVAKLAGLPESITKRASSILTSHEMGSRGQVEQLSLIPQAAPLAEPSKQSDKWKEKIESLDLNTMTPIEALNTLSKWRQELS